MAKVTLLDFWAPWCIDPQTPVLTENGYLAASQIQLGDNLITIDPVTKKQKASKVSRLKIYRSVPSYKMVLETGRALIGDSNHLVLTDNGFKQMRELQKGDKVLVNPSVIHSTYDSKDNKIILEDTSNIFADRFLKEQNLLPLTLNDQRMPILARLLGFVITGGYLYEDLKHSIYETHFFVGTEDDANRIKADLQSLGFAKLEIKKRTNKRIIAGREFNITTLRCRSLNRALFFLLKGLGAPVGRKKKQSYFVPNWIMDGNEALKREFMGGWLGGDGCKIDYYIKYEALNAHDAGFEVNAIEFHKEKDLEREGILYAEQLAALLHELGVKVSAITSIDDEDGVIIFIRVATDYQSLLNLAKIGYTYARSKQAKTPFVKEFLSYRLFERERYVQLKQAVRQQLSVGVSNSVIAQNLQIPQRTVVSWRYNDSSTTHPPLNGQARFDVWLKDRQQEELLWEQVLVVEKVGDRDVVGITVGDPHTIVTNGIVSHNCGPCKMMAPILDEIKNEFKEVEIKEINVDEEPQKAQDFNVLGIPTYVIMKDDKEVGRKVGVTAKSELIKLMTS